MRTLHVYLVSALALLALLIASVPTHPAQAQSTDAFTGEYFGNVGLTGTPILVRDDPAVEFNWGAGAPDPRLAPRNFSARWTRWFKVPAAGVYLFEVSSADGSRLWVDGDPVVDMWYDHAPLSRTVSLDLLPGYHLLRVEYYNHANPAFIHLAISSESGYPDWKGEYFSNQDLNGDPAVIRNDGEINFNWAAASPAPDIPVDHFSVRWTRDQYFDAGNYRFTARADDGIRVWVGSRLLIDQWKAQSPTTYTADLALTAGNYPLRVEYFDEKGSAVAVFSWARIAEANIWTGQYFNNMELSSTPALISNDAALDFNWGVAGPGQGISGSVFSARWDGVRLTPSTGFYTLYATADDGVRVSLDGKVVIDEWHDSPPVTHAITLYLTAGNHNWHVDYYQHLGTATLSVEIVPGVSPPSSSAKEITVEKDSLGWLSGGNPANWRTAPNGRGGRAFWAMNNAFIQPLNAWARWYPSLPEARSYEVFAYIPANLANTRSARYLIAHGGDVSAVPLAQALYSDQWASLGTHYFDATGGEYVSLSDVTYECYLCSTVVWDAVKFVPQ